MNEKRTLTKIAIACFLGGAIGTLVAAAAGIFWPVGLVVGFLVGYLCYDFSTVVSTVKKVWGKTVTKEEVTEMKDIALKAMVPFVLVHNIALVIVIVWQAPHLLDLGWSRFFHDVLITIPITLCNSFIVAIAASRECIKKGEGFVEGERKEAVMLAISLPVTLFFGWALLLVYHAGWFIWDVVKTIPQWPAAISRAAKAVWRAIAFCGRFVKNVFIEIYSDLRLICGAGALIGALIGWSLYAMSSGRSNELLASVLIGGLIGIVFGILNYKIVSIKILKLNPEKIRK